MKKSSIVKTLILILAVVLNVMVMRSLHVEQLKINKDRATMSKLPLASFHKFWADVKWILYIQKLGSIELSTENNSRDFYNDAMSIVSLDPSFYKVYEISSLMLSSKTPDLAIDLLRKGQTTQKLSNDWRLFSMAGNICQQQTILSKLTDKNINLISDAIGYYREAMKRENFNTTIRKSYMKLRAQEVHFKDNNKNIIVAELKEWEKFVNENFLSEEMGATVGGELAYALDDDSERDILSLIQQIKRDAPEDLEGKKLIDNMIKSILKDLNTCRNCYAVYHPGDKFCSNCSGPVKIVGVCVNTNCGKVNRGGNFCEFCGTKVVRPVTPATLAPVK